MSLHKYFATCGRGIEHILAGELEAIGAADVEPGRGGVSFAGDKAMLYRAVDSAKLDPSEDELVTAWSAAVTVMEHAALIATTAIKVCGGQSMLRHLPLERMYRDARLGSLMLLCRRTLKS